MVGCRSQWCARIDFVIAGVDKSGTSFVHEALQNNANICMPSFEVVTFLPSFYNKKTIESLVSQLDPLRVSGIKRPDYIFNINSMYNIRNSCGSPKIIIILRDPVVRAISHFYHFRRYGIVKFVSFDEFVDAMIEEDIGRLGARAWQIERFSFPVEAINTCKDIFGYGNILLLNFEQLLEDPAVLIADLCAFIDVEPAEIPAMQKIPQQVIYHDKWQSYWAKASRVEGILNDDGVVIAKREHSLTPARRIRAEKYRELAHRYGDFVEKPRFPNAQLNRLRDHFAVSYRQLADLGLEFNELEKLRQIPASIEAALGKTL